MQIYLVGGAVRDRLLGIDVYDRDWVVVGTDASEMLNLGFQPVGKDFPVFLHPDSHEEYALARTERKSGQGYGGFQFHAAADVTLEQDLLRRDLTINAIAEDDQGRLYDPYHGQQDLQQRLFRHVSPAFAEDPLRVLRVARFLARFHHLGFTIAPETLALMQRLSLSGELLALSAERVWKETERALQEPNPQHFFITLARCGALKALMPELALDLDPEAEPETDPVTDPETDLATDLETPHAVAINALIGACSFSNDAAVRWATFCHITDSLEALEQLHQRLKIPKHFREAATLLWRFHQLLQQPLTAASVMTLYQGLDLQRRPERLTPFIEGCRAIAGDDSEKLLASANALEQLIAQIGAIQPRQLVNEGFKGAKLGQELQRRQYTTVEQLLHPQTTD
ncbi:MAG: hypothetical protein V7707_08320 [Motiliproteus sp.]